MSTKEEILLNYSNSVQELLRRSDLNESDLERIYFESVAEIESIDDTIDLVDDTNHSNNNLRWKFLWHRLAWWALLAALVFYNVKPVYRFGVCTLQEYIYPGLRHLRTASIPIIGVFPGLIELYDETCLLQNPLFRVVGMECWPCNGVETVSHTARPDQTMTQPHKPPFVYKTNQEPIHLRKLKELYDSNIAVFDRDASKVYKNDRVLTNPKEMLDTILDKETLQTENYYIWRINRIATAQALRRIIPRPKIVPQLGQSTERFILIDFSSKSFRLPDPECNFVFLLQIKGNRIVELHPAKECAGRCKSITVLLKESDLLWYNWWYWRPITQASSRNETSIAHMGSYC